MPKRMRLGAATFAVQGQDGLPGKEQNPQKLFGTEASTCSPQTSHLTYFGRNITTRPFPYPEWAVSSPRDAPCRHGIYHDRWRRAVFLYSPSASKGCHRRKIRLRLNLKSPSDGEYDQS